ncbi:TetR/AcrR family transcriptional regulator [Anaerosporobacter faecicola]|uniref:TetR/AcrR family transcriptional regulator n=1 Tax=Anaerosporobacter faecicola TaxID=2718714 RepID=UPI00143B61FE|nr:TetR/AcrR family transcriptional regulator [Anaerosporobacter faecicola]
MSEKTMSEKTMYHHGNLKETLIEKGIDYVNQNGYSTLSLRKLATMCDVSHAAVYKHFSNKEELFLAMKEHVKEAFANQLEAAEINHKNDGNEEILYGLATAYIQLFMEYPAYFNFIYTAGDISIDFDQPQMTSNYRAFDIFRNAAYRYMNELGVEESEKVKMIVGMWAVVHGITEIAIMKGTKYSGDWKEMIRSILQNNFYISGEEK